MNENGLDLDWLNSDQPRHIYKLTKVGSKDELVKDEKNWYAEDQLVLWRAQPYKIEMRVVNMILPYLHNVITGLAF